MTEDDPRQRAAATKRDRTRTALLSAAWVLFDEKGWDGTSLDEVAQRAGVSVATLYNHFPTKDALVYPLASQLIEDVMTDVDTDIQAQIDPVELLKRYVTRLARLFARHRRLIISMLIADLIDIDGRDDVAFALPSVHTLAGPLSRLLYYGNFRELEANPRLSWNTLAHYHTRSLMMLIAFEPNADAAEWLLSQLLPALTYVPRP